MKEILNLIFSLITELVKGIFTLIEEIINHFTKKDHSKKASFGEQRKTLHYRHQGIAIGDTAISLEKSLEGGGLILGKSGSGKSSLVFKNQLFRAPDTRNNQGQPISYVALDPSGEILKDCGAMLEAKGYEIEVINFSEADKSSISWNPLINLKNHEVSRFASDYIETSMGANNNSDPFWNLSASRILTWATHTLRQFDTPYQTLHNALFLIQKLSGSQEEIDILMSHKNIPDWLYDQYASVINMGEKVLPSVLATVIASLNLFSDPNIQTTTSNSLNNLNMNTYRTQPKILFIQNKVMNQEYVSGLNSLLFMAWFSQAMSSLPKQDEHTLIFMCDECSSLKMKKSILPLAASNLRKHNSFGIFGYQSFAQVEQLLGREGATTLRQNTGTILYLPNQDLQTSRAISEQLGKYTYEDKKGIQRERELLTADEVSFLSNDGGILFSGNQRGIVLKNIKPFYKIRKYLDWSKKDSEPLSALKIGYHPLLPIEKLINKNQEDEEE